jgi:hypothetical protein
MLTVFPAATAAVTMSDGKVAGLLTPKKTASSSTRPIASAIFGCT